MNFKFQCDGLSVIDELLSSRYSSLEDRIESAGLLAQITSPWITDNHKIDNLDTHVASMVSSLTGQCTKTPLYTVNIDTIQPPFWRSSPKLELILISDIQLLSHSQTLSEI